MLFPLILRRCEEKKVKFFYNNFAISAVVIYRCFVLIDLINDEKNVYSHNNNNNNNDNNNNNNNDNNNNV